MLASKNKCRIANFAHGFLLHEGKTVKKDIEQAIHYYKEASSFNIEYAKNNLGVIYRHGYGQTPGNSSNAIVYFEEAIRQKNDYLSMYNLAHIYIYELYTKENINKGIDLLFKSLDKKIFPHSLILLCVVLLHKNIDIEKEISNRQYITNDLKIYICQIKNFLLADKPFIDFLYELFKNKVFLYNIEFQPVLASDVEKEYHPPPKYPNAKNLTSEFYEGFGIDLN